MSSAQNVQKVSKYIVLKFGGNTLANMQLRKKVAEIVKQKISQGLSPIVVVSACGDETDQLLELAAQISLQPRRELDLLLSTAECKSGCLLALCLDTLAVPSKVFANQNLPLLSWGEYGAGFVAAVDSSQLIECFAQEVVPIVPGFFGKTSAGELYSLGRGGSDISAVALARELDCDCHFYRDVGGVYTADPNIVENAKQVTKIDIATLQALSQYGCGLINAHAAHIISRHKVNLTISDLNGSNLTAIDDTSAVHTPIIGYKDNALLIEIAVEQSQRDKVMRQIKDSNKIIDKRVFIEDGKLFCFINTPDKSVFELLLRETAGNCTIQNERSASCIAVVGMNTDQRKLVIQKMSDSSESVVLEENGDEVFCYTSQSILKKKVQFLHQELYP